MNSPIFIDSLHPGRFVSSGVIKTSSRLHATSGLGELGYPLRSELLQNSKKKVNDCSSEAVMCPQEHPGEEEVREERPA